LIVEKITKACSNLREKFELWNSGAYTYKEDGRDIMIRFLGINGDVPQL
jgi:hypothetical protein